MFGVQCALLVQFGKVCLNGRVGHHWLRAFIMSSLTVSVLVVIEDVGVVFQIHADSRAHSNVVQIREPLRTHLSAVFAGDQFITGHP
jgi:hypothetical protein